MRIVFDMDGTLVGAFRGRRGTEFCLNERLFQVASALRAEGHELAIWTFGNRNWWRQVRAWWPQLLSVFTHVYTRDDLAGHITSGGGQAERVKDIRRIGGDLLIDNDPAHKRWAERHGLGERYLIVPTFGLEAS